MRSLITLLSLLPLACHDYSALDAETVSLSDSMAVCSPIGTFEGAPISCSLQDPAPGCEYRWTTPDEAFSVVDETGASISFNAPATDFRTVRLHTTPADPLCGDSRTNVVNLLVAETPVAHAPASSWNASPPNSFLPAAVTGPISSTVDNRGLSFVLADQAAVNNFAALSTKNWSNIFVALSGPDGSALNAGTLINFMTRATATAPFLVNDFSSPLSNTFSALNSVFITMQDIHPQQIDISGTLNAADNGAVLQILFDYAP
jgi:hypothetical protein